MRRTWLPALISILLVATMAVPALAGKADKARPFKATTEIVERANPVCPAEYNGGEYSEHVGTATHLGRFDLFETLCINTLTLPPFPFVVNGKLVAANGDELYFDAEGAFDPVTNTIESTGWLFDGGTGRFESATGQADETLIRNSDNLIIGLTVKGTITYDASDRSN